MVRLREVTDVSCVHEAIQILEGWRKSGDRTLPSGTRLICRVPHVAPEAWFHELYVGLESTIIDEYERRFPVGFPKAYRDFLHLCNGINAFSDSLRIFGYRFTYDSVGDAAIQPYSLLDANTPRPREIPDSWLFFGGYRWDGSRVFFDTAEPGSAVYRAQKGKTAVLNRWVSFESWLLEEIVRLSGMYDMKGFKINPQEPTIP